MNNRFEDIRNWAESRNLVKGSDPKSQMLKLAEEMGELAGALARGKESEADDAIGDMVVVLTILSAQRGVSIETCIEGAWQEIKDRKGRMTNNIFIKEGD
jgi:NTP pyrophosphatase (non-canonical NTP hydrolase)